MGLNIEHYKGIEFIRISSLPSEQQKRVWESFERDKIIKIVRDQSLMNDCILYPDYAAWQAKVQRVDSAEPIYKDALGKLAFE